MEDFKYSNLNIVELNNFLRDDTDNYKDFDNSLCGKAYNLETKTIDEDKMVISILTNQIKTLENQFEAQKENIKENGAKKGFLSGLFAKSKVNKELKKSEIEFETNMKTLKERLDEHNSLLQSHTLMLQETFNILQEKGFSWSELKKLIEEKIRQGILSLNSNSNSKKPKVKIPTEEDYDISELMLKMKKKMETKNNNEDLLKEKHFLDDPNKVDLSIFNPFERTEFENLLRNYNYNRKMVREYENARMLRMCFLYDNSNHNRYNNLAFGLSDYAFEGLFSFIFSDNSKKYRSFYSEYKVANACKDTKRIRLLDLFFADKTKNLLASSGYSLSYIQRNGAKYERELKNILTNPKELYNIIDKFKTDKNSKEIAGKSLVDKFTEIAKSSSKEKQIEKQAEMQQVLEKSGPEISKSQKK